MSASSAADGLWLHALSDPLTNCKSTTNLMRFADINVDGDVCLAVCDLERNLKIYKGTSLVSVHSLLDTPTALCVAYIDKATPRTPTLAVAGGSYVFIYRHLRPYRKWTCPKVTVPAEEAAVWEGLKTGELTQQSACTKLDEHRMAGINLTSRSAELLGMPDSKRPEYVRSMKDADYQQHTLITCMEALKVDSSESDGMCCLVVGTENRELYILPSDPANSMVMCKVDLPSVPVLLNASGLLDVEWRVAIICRDQKLYSVKNGDAKGQAVLSGISIDLDAQGVSMTQQDNLLWVATTNRKITCYTTRGKVQRVIVVPSDVVDLSTITIRHSSKCHLLLVALTNGEVCLYKDGGLVHMFAVEKPITGIRFGQYGREDNTLCIVHGKGALTIKIWKRTNKVDLLKADSGPPREQDVPIPVPKKTRLYVEQLQREKEQGADIHHLFHRDLCRLRLETARAYVKVLTDVNMGAHNVIGRTSNVKMSVLVEGLGPKFVMKLTLQNTGTLPVLNSRLLFSFDDEMYCMGYAASSNASQCIMVPMLIPGPKLTFEAEVLNIDPLGRAGQILVLMQGNDSSAVPILSASVLMPTSELFDAS